ncbi:SH3 domain-containing protein [Exiguobacterium sp. s193]|uniref:SH3 domain-containing protein n=1 Tax=Exiguobacterium sp. s193 TaxID=2751207 RepID=UPI001BE6252A|nr:SH3 domain-containing protein [Exiguobacterium sp. s193]
MKLSFRIGLTLLLLIALCLPALPAQAASYQVIVTSTIGANVRSQPSTSSSATITRRAPYKAKFTAVSYTNGWYKIKDGSAYRYLSNQVAKKVTTGSSSSTKTYKIIVFSSYGANVRTSPSTASSKNIKRLATYNSKFNAVSYSNGWYKVKGKVNYYYVSSQVAKKVTTGAPATSSSYPVASMRYFKIGSSGYEVSKASTTRRYPASTTKLLTALVAYDAAAKKGTLDQRFTLTYSMLAVPAGSSTAGFRSGDQVTLRQLLNGMLIRSGNDAAKAIAVRTAGSESAFVSQMNSRAKSLGMTASHFMNPHGFYHPSHYTTAADMQKLANAYAQYHYLIDVSGRKSYQTKVKGPYARTLTWYHTNTSLPNDSRIYASKTGYTPESAYTRVFFIKKGSTRYGLVTLKGTLPQTETTLRAVLNR